MIQAYQIFPGKAQNEMLCYYKFTKSISPLLTEKDGKVTNLIRKHDGCLITMDSIQGAKHNLGRRYDCLAKFIQQSCVGGEKHVHLQRVTMVSQLQYSDLSVVLETCSLSSSPKYILDVSLCFFSSQSQLLRSEQKTRILQAHNFDIENLNM